MARPLRNFGYRCSSIGNVLVVRRAPCLNTLEPGGSAALSLEGAVHQLPLPARLHASALCS